jgi:hypothetical protein
MRVVSQLDLRLERQANRRHVLGRDLVDVESGGCRRSLEYQLLVRTDRQTIILSRF